MSSLSVICRGESDPDAIHAGRITRIAVYMRDLNNPAKVDLWVTTPVLETRKYVSTAERQDNSLVTRDRLYCPLCRFTLVKKEDERFHATMTKLLDAGVSEVSLRELAGILA